MVVQEGAGSMHGTVAACRCCNAAGHLKSPCGKLFLLSGEQLLAVSLISSRGCSAVFASIGKGFDGSREASENLQEGTWLLQCSSIFLRELLLQLLWKLNYSSKYCPEVKDARALRFHPFSCEVCLNHIFCSKRDYCVVHDPWQTYSWSSVFLVPAGGQTSSPRAPAVMAKVLSGVTACSCKL